MPAAQSQPTSFRSVFGSEAQIATRAPGRINVIGEHVDYQGGLVLPAAIDRHIFAHAAKTAEPHIRLWSAEIGGAPLLVPLDHAEPFTGDHFWANYVFGVIAKYRDAGHPAHGLDIAFDSTLPAGAGLSSSAAIEAATALVVEAAGAFHLPPVERALLCQSADHEYVGVPCGIMDQLAVNAGVADHLLQIDCRSLEVTPAKLPDGLALIAVDSRVKHTLADGEYGKRRADCETAAAVLGADTLRDATLDQLRSAHAELDQRVYLRARHVITEIARVGAFTTALDHGDAQAAGTLMAACHTSLRDDYQVSCPELDALVLIAEELGALGARMMGAGFGGSTINLVRTTDADRLATEICTLYHQRHGKEVEAFIVHPVAGATIL